MQAAGSAGTSVTNAGTATSLARSDHEHRVPWQVGAHFEATPAVAESTVPLPVNEACGGSIDATAVHITALTKGSAAMTFNVVRYNSAGTSQGNLFASNQSYSNTGNNRQSFTPDQNNTNIGSTDYFRVNFVTVNGQDDLTVATRRKMQKRKLTCLLLLALLSSAALLWALTGTVAPDGDFFSGGVGHHAAVVQSGRRH